MDIASEASLIVSTLGTVGISGLFLYIKGIKADTKETKEEITKLRNGCFDRHSKLERELGQAEMVRNALHRRVDDIEETIKE